MNLNHLALFHAVALEGSVSRGADRLSISQPAVSRQLSEFERSLKTRLFDRLPRGVRLTPAGDLLFSYARRLFALEAEAERSLQELHGLERGRLSLGASTTIGSYLLPGVLARFHARYPGIDVSLEIANTEEIQRHILEGTLDMGLTEGFAEEENLESAVFMQDELVAILPVGHPLSSSAGITLERLSQEPFVLRERGSGTRAVIERALAARSLSARPALALGSTEAIKRAVEAGAGVAIVSRLSVAAEERSGVLSIHPIAGVSLLRPLHRLHLKGRHPSGALHAFGIMLSETASSPAPG